jgi:hypothetical protein
LRDLALLHESAGDHALAIAALEEARNITRFHEGFSTADEALLLREQIRGEKALGNDQRAWDLEQDMITIARQHYDDVRMAPIFRELTDDRSDALRVYRGGEFPPEMEVGCYYVPDVRPYHDKRGDVRRLDAAGSAPDGVSCRSGQSSSVLVRLQGEILAYYADAIEVVLRNGDYANGELRDLEKQMLRARRPNQTSRMALLSPSRAGCGNGLRRIPVWALDELLALDLLGRCLEPVIHFWGMPVGANAHERVGLSTAAAASSRCIDVALAVTKQGEGERIEILATSKGATRAEQRGLIRLIESASFRPRFVGGELADSAPVVVRYPLGP